MEPFAAVDISANPRGRITFGVPLDPFAPWSPDGGCGCGCGDTGSNADQGDCGSCQRRGDSFGFGPPTFDQLLDPLGRIEIPLSPGWGGGRGEVFPGPGPGPHPGVALLPSFRCSDTWDFLHASPTIPPFREWEGGGLYLCLLGTATPDEGAIEAQAPRYDLELPGACCGVSPDMNPRDCVLPSQAAMAAAAAHVVIRTEGCDELLPGGLFEEIVTTTWALMIENLDIVEWILCYLQDVWALEGYSFWNLQTCFSDAVTGAPFEVVGRRLNQRFWAAAEPGVRQIRLSLCSGGVFRDSVFQQWQHAASDLDKLCLALGNAVVMFHEIMHYCGPVHDHPNSPCDPAYTLSNVLPSLLAQRYPCLSGSGCCDQWSTNPTAGVKFRISLPPYIGPCL